jgi:hypothetical protein
MYKIISMTTDNISGQQEDQSKQQDRSKPPRKKRRYE